MKNKTYKHLIPKIYEEDVQNEAYAAGYKALSEIHSEYKSEDRKRKAKLITGDNEQIK
jgi:hypothetical protein